MKNVRDLVIVLGDQLDADAALFDDFDPERDVVWMAETCAETEHVWSHKLRVAGFLAAMRHFREALRARGFTVCYTELTRDRADDRGADHAELLRLDAEALEPERLRVTHPGDHRVLELLRGAADDLGLTLDVVSDRHFYSTPDEFSEWADGRKRMVLEHFYRALRKRHSVLMEDDRQPVGGEWNYDAENRDAFGKEGPGAVPAPPRFAPDAITEGVIELVEQRFAEHPGRLEDFALPVTAEQAAEQLDDFIEHRLAKFGRFQDAIWVGEPFLHHSLLSFALNLKLISPRDCVDAAVEAWAADRAPLNSVEGFVRQILGWREYVRGLYWHHMPEYAERNALEAEAEVPGFFWDGETDMVCVADAMQGVLDHGYSHHIQRLMVFGLFAMLAGVRPRRFHEWHMAMYIDAVDWVSLPNALGMSQYGDGGLVGTKPYCASGNYIDKMSNACGSCRYRPREAVGDEACPFTTLYWDFLARHRQRFSGNRRMNFQLANLDRKGEQLEAIRAQAAELLDRLAAGERI